MDDFPILVFSFIIEILRGNSCNFPETDDLHFSLCIKFFHYMIIIIQNNYLWCIKQIILQMNQAFCLNETKFNLKFFSWTKRKFGQLYNKQILWLDEENIFQVIDKNSTSLFVGNDSAQGADHFVEARRPIMSVNERLFWWSCTSFTIRMTNTVYLALISYAEVSWIYYRCIVRDSSIHISSGLNNWISFMLGSFNHIAILYISSAKIVVVPKICFGKKGFLWF